MKKSWTPEECQVLRLEYPHRTRKELEAIFSRPGTVIKDKAKELGIRKTQKILDLTRAINAAKGRAVMQRKKLNSVNA